MRKIVNYTIIFTVLFVFHACKNPDSTLSGSNLDTSSQIFNDTDRWAAKNFTDPYNIAIKYRWDENSVDLNRYLTPADPEKVLRAAKVIKAVWIDPYTEVGGEDFIKKVAPRELRFLGGVNLNPDGRTKRLGAAESGKRIQLDETNIVKLDVKADLLTYVGTIQHEYTHILNQTKPFDEKAYEKITPSGYTKNWYAESDNVAMSLGFISAYARSEPREDIAEMVRVMLSNTKEEYDAIVDGITQEDAKNNLRRKEQIVVDYFKNDYNIDFYRLQRVVARNVDKIINP